MKLHQLAALVTASESGSLRQAAEKMRLSQPALSRSIRELELETGVKLLERTALGVKATIYGEALLLRSKLVEAALRQARDDIAPLRAATHGDLRIGATPVGAFSLLHVVLARFKKSRPHLPVTVSDGMGERLLRGLRHGIASLEIIHWAGLQQDCVSRGGGVKCPLPPTGVTRRTGSPLSPAALSAITERRPAAQPARAGRKATLATELTHRCAWSPSTA